MSILNSGIVPVGSTGYDIDNSLRFNDDDSAYLNRTPSVAGNRKTWTWSGWVKRGKLGVNQKIFQQRADSNSSQQCGLQFKDDDTLRLLDQNSGSTVMLKQTTQVFRDTSAWYHIVVAVDITESAVADKAKLYVNGEEITDWSISTNYANNTTYDTAVNNTVRFLLGVQRPNSSSTINSYLDGYLAEVNFVDGQALTPADFGETDETYGHWKAKKYEGTYGTNGFYLDFSGKKAIEIDGQYDYADSNLAINTSNAFTTSGWANIPAVLGTGMQGFFGANANSESNRSYVGIRDGKYWFGVANSQQYTASASALPVNEWFHWAVACSGSTATYYINGVQVATMAYGGGSLQNATNWIGHVNTSAGTALNADGIGLHKEVAIWTSQLTTANVVSLYNSGTPIDATTISSGTLEGYWKLDETTGITAADSSGNSHTADLVNVTWGLGADSSGNSNNWLTNNLAATDQMLDSPTNNFCTWNPLDKGSSYTLSEGNLEGIATADWFAVKGTQGVSSGKRYFEVCLNSSAGLGDQMAGLCGEDTKLSGSSPLAQDAPPIVLYHFGGLVTKNGSNVQTGLTAMTVGAILGVAVDFDASTVQFYVDNVAQGTAESLPTTDLMLPIHVGANGRTVTANFGQDSSFAGNKTAQGNADDNGYGDFYYAPPTGYLALCTQNLPEPTVVPSEHFNTVLYTGNGSTQSITGVGFQPDWVWAKARSNSHGHGLFDVLRGYGDFALRSDTTQVEGSTEGVVSATSSDGFTVDVDGTVGYHTNENNTTYVAWNWKANGTGVSNTNGTITSTVSANVDAGFSIVSYTGSNIENSTIGHGLSSAPELIIFKNRDATESWTTFYDNNDIFWLNDTSGFSSGRANYTNKANSQMTTTLWVGGSLDPDHPTVNRSPNKFIAYCFHSVEGYSKVGSYTGNGSTDGTFVHCGFRPRYIMIKRTDTTRSWAIFDTARSTYNLVDDHLQADTSNVEDVANALTSIDILSNGFKNRNNEVNTNASGGTYIFLAFAEHPFKYSTAK
jgi:hypothetical protein